VARAPAALILDDGELDDVQEILEGLGVEFARVRGGAIVANMPPPKALLVATPRRISAIAQIDSPPGAAGTPIRVVVVKEDSNRLREQLREIGFDYLVRRPVHPEALRLLMMHSLYCGEERRREPRVAVGLEVSFRTGELPRRATLVDLSTGGCRLFSTYPLETDKQIRVNLPESVGATEPLTIEGKILRTSFDERLGTDGMYSTSVQFENLSADVRHELEWIIEDKVGGPPALCDAEGAAREWIEESEREVAPPRRSETPDTVTRRGKAARRHRGLVEKVSPRCQADPRSEGATAQPSSSATVSEITGATAGFAISVDVKMAPIERDPPKLEMEAPEFETDPSELETEALELETDPPDLEAETLELETDPPDLEAEALELETDPPDLEAEAPERETESPANADGSPSERRTTGRHPYGAKIPAFGSRALRVLVGRDLGMGGMRIEYHPDLEVGDRLNLAIYGAAGEEPFLVWGTIARSEGTDGMALIFDPVHPVIAEKLEKLVATLPAVESLHDDEAAAMGTVLTEILNE
jgi:hypothetical protein